MTAHCLLLEFVWQFILRSEYFPGEEFVKFDTFCSFQTFFNCQLLIIIIILNPAKQYAWKYGQHFHIIYLTRSTWHSFRMNECLTLYCLLIHSISNRIQLEFRHKNDKNNLISIIENGAIGEYPRESN